MGHLREEGLRWQRPKAPDEALAVEVAELKAKLPRRREALEGGQRQAEAGVKDLRKCLW